MQDALNGDGTKLELLPKVVSEMVGDALPGRRGKPAGLPCHCGNNFWPSRYRAREQNSRVVFTTREREMAGDRGNIQWPLVQ
jgi:hypothetical protein